VGEQHVNEATTQAILERFRPVFYPVSLAVVGASRSGGGFLRRILDFGFQGSIYPINPQAQEILGLRAYPRVTAVPDVVEYAIISVPTHLVPAALEDCAAAGVKAAHIYTSGFNEIGEPQGLRLQQEVVRIAQAGGVRVIGPNCMGIYSPGGRLTYIDGVSPEQGVIGIVSQSGGFATDLARRGQVRGIRYSKIASIGNSCDLTPADFLEYYAIDPETRLIGMYVEGSEDLQRLFSLIEQTVSAKPIVLLKGGRLQEGVRTARRHTGLAAGNYALWQEMVSRSGIVVVDNLEDLLDVLVAMAMLPPMRGNRLAIIGPGGGVSVTSVDTCERLGLTVPRLSPATLMALEALKLPAGSVINNPVDTQVDSLIVDEGRILRRILDAVVGDPQIDAVMIHLNMQNLFMRAEGRRFFPNLIDAIIAVVQRLQIPLAAVLRSTGEPFMEEIRFQEQQRLTAANIPVFLTPTQALEAMAKVAHFDYRYPRTRAQPR
jgi:acyl-CoA synthetase (NDP forming)